MGSVLLHAMYCQCSWIVYAHTDLPDYWRESGVIPPREGIGVFTDLDNVPRTGTIADFARLRAQLCVVVEEVKFRRFRLENAVFTRPHPASAEVVYVLTPEQAIVRWSLQPPPASPTLTRTQRRRPQPR